jgi:hypothetical protein
MNYRMTRRQYKEAKALEFTQQAFKYKPKAKIKLPSLFKRRFATTINEKQITFYAITKSEARAQFKALYGKVPVGQKFTPY